MACLDPKAAARVAAKLQGFPDLALAVIPHRVGGETEEDQKAKAAANLARQYSGGCSLT